MISFSLTSCCCKYHGKKAASYVLLSIMIHWKNDNLRNANANLAQIRLVGITFKALAMRNIKLFFVLVTI